MMPIVTGNQLTFYSLRFLGAICGPRFFASHNDRWTWWDEMLVFIK
jgi:hypothetical protein